MKNDFRKYTKEFYPAQLLSRAAADYANIADIHISDSGTHFTCEFSDCVVDSGWIMSEFDNYLIELLSQSRLPEE